MYRDFESDSCRVGSVYGSRYIKNNLDTFLPNDMANVNAIIILIFAMLRITEFQIETKLGRLCWAILSSVENRFILTVYEISALGYRSSYIALIAEQ